jgi:predicted ATPase/tRNA A-37 threonylcarbamoyl transferase component Bud32
MIALSGVTIHSKIYESSASLVYRGTRVRDDRAIVVKLLKQDYPSPQELTRYRQEYDIMRSLHLKGVVEVYSQQNYQRTLVILLEDFGGESLEHWMRNRPETFRPMQLAPFLQLAIDLTDILGKIHAANIIHKNINPGNIVLNPVSGVVKIIDFGIATQFNRTNPTFKSPHVLEGTLAYLSPEQTGRMNRLIDYRTDFYSLGVTFYELLTGQLPFPTTDILEVVHCHLAKSPIPPYKLNAKIPKPISDIILKLMAKNVEDRYQSNWGIKADLEDCADQLETSGQINAFHLGLQDASDRFQIPQKLYGREEEIAALLESFERVAGGNDVEIERRGEENDNIPASPLPHVSASSEMMLVSGSSGIGKSALVKELCKPITAKQGYFISGKFDQFQRNIPYSAIADALRKLVQQLLSEPDEQLQKWRSQLLNALGSNGQLIIDVIPEVELIVGRQSPVPEVGSIEAQNRFSLVFQKFIRACCSSKHPLVIFLDDLQWVDFATLRLIELILSDRAMQFLLLIGAYRDNEVTQIHPLSAMIEKLKQENVAINQITLAPLEQGAVAQLIAETLHTPSESSAPLAELVWHKTNGNPYFTNEFLKTLYTEDLIVFNINQQHWEWDIAQIKAKNITDNVVELMIGKLEQLSEKTQRALRLAACVGAEFDLATLTAICERPAVEIFTELTTVIQLELILATSELDENLLIQNYKFSHDRVQQAAYTLIDDSQKQVVHLQIGRSLLEKTLPEQITERLFEIVDHLNYGIELVTDQSERNEIAKLNLLASQKAKGAIAYNTAQNYLATGRTWLAASSWQTNYDLTLELYIATTEVAYLCGEFEQVKSWVGVVLQQAKTILDIVKVYEVNIQTDMAQSQPLRAINTALRVLQQLGISFPEEPSQLELQLELNTISFLLSKKSIKDLSHLPEMTEPKQLAAMRILSSITIAAYVAAPNLMPLLVFKQVSLSIEHGNASVSPFAYAFYGLILCGTVGDIETGYQFGQLALSLLSHPKTHSLRARTLLIVNNFTIHWKELVRDTSQPLLEAYQSGLETGDLEFAAYCVHCYCFQSYAVGKELVEVEREMTTYNEQSSNQTGNSTNLESNISAGDRKFDGILDQSNPSSWQILQ